MKSSLRLGILLWTFAPAAFGSQALTNLIDKTAARNCFAAYTNNVLRIEAVDASEWNADRRLDRLPFDMPFQLVVGPNAEDRQTAEAALTTVTTSMPAHVRAYFEEHRLMAPLLQWMIRRNKPGITNETLYLSAAAHPNVWRAKDFDLSRLADAARQLTSNNIPMMASIAPIYEEIKLNPIKRAEPLVDYPDPRPEETYRTPFGLAIVLRATENKRKFRILAVGYPLYDRNVNFKWIHKGGMWLTHFQGMWGQQRLDKGYCEAYLDWWGAVRRDILVFARYGEGPWGPPTVVSFYRVPNEKRQYDKDGRIQSIEYLPAKDVIPTLYQNKPWRDVYAQDSLGRVFGFFRTRTGQVRDEPFTILGESVLETHAGDLPKITAKVRYFTREDDPTTLDYEVTDETMRYPNKPFVPRDRGEFPTVKPRRK